MSDSEQTCHAQSHSRIRELNDAARKRMSEGRIMLTPGVIAKGETEVGDLLVAISNFDHFDDENDPYGEHDFGALDWCGETAFWKIDYYDLELSAASPNPADAEVTIRVLTVMLASEY